MKLRSCALACLILSSGPLAHGGVDTGNPKEKFLNRVFNYQLEYPAKIFEIDDSEKTRVELRAKSLSSSVSITAQFTQIERLGDLLKELPPGTDLSQCSETVVNRLSGYRCPTRFILLSAGNAFFVIDFTRDPWAEEIVRSFSETPKDRMPLLKAKYLKESYNAGHAILGTDWVLTTSYKDDWTLRNGMSWELVREFEDSRDWEFVAHSPALARVVGSHGSKLRSWSLATGRIEWTIDLWSHRIGAADSAAFTSDGRSIVVVFDKQMAEISAESGQWVRFVVPDNGDHQLIRPIVGQVDGVELVASTYEGPKTGNRGIEIRDFRTGNLLHRLPIAGYALHWVGEDLVFLVRDADLLTRLVRFNLKSLRAAWQRAIRIRYGRLTIQGSRAAVFNNEGNIRLWDLEAGEELPFEFAGESMGESNSRMPILLHSHPVLIDFTHYLVQWFGLTSSQVARLESPGELHRTRVREDLNRIYSLNSLNEIRVYDARKRKLLQQWRLPVSAYDFEVSQDGQTLYLIHRNRQEPFDAALSLFMMGTGQLSVEQPLCRSQWLTTFVLDRRSSTLLYECDQSIRAFDLRRREPYRYWWERLETFRSNLLGMSLSPTGRRLAFWFEDGHYEVRHSDTGSLLEEIGATGKVIVPNSEGEPRKLWLQNIEFVGDNELAITTGPNHLQGPQYGLVVRSIRSGNDLAYHEIEKSHQLAISPNGSVAAIILRDRVRIYDILSGRIKTTLFGHQNRNCGITSTGPSDCLYLVKQLQFLNGKELVTSGFDGVIRVWDLGGL